MNDETIKEFNEELAQERLENDYPWIVFAINNTEYGINSKYVLSIEILEKITPIVDAAHYCPGITESRGEMIDLLDLRALFGLGNYLMAKEGNDDERYMMVVLELADKKRGMIVDEIVSVEYITQFIDGIVGEENCGANSHYISQIAKREKLDNPVLIIKPESISNL